MPACNLRDTRYLQFNYKNQKFNNSFFPFYCKTWNSLPTKTKKLNVDDFKLELKNNHKPKKYKHFSRGQKKLCTLLTQIRVERSNLNSHKFQVGKIDNPKCLCEDPNENSLHFVTCCWLFTEERRILFDQVEQYIPQFRSLSKKRQYEILVNGYNLDNPDLLHINTQIMKMTQHFIFKTKRFK